MTGIEVFTHDCPEKAGGEYYERIAADVLQDLNLLRVVSKLHVSVDPGIPLFIVVGVIRKLPPVVKIRDIANVQPKGNRLTLSIGDETYLAPLLSILWGRYGKSNVEQPDRWTVVITIPEGGAEGFEEIPVYDPREDIFRDLMYAMVCIQPEGFKVRKEAYKDGKFWFVASEDTLPEDVVENQVREKFALIGEEL
ncbi:MAG TPA: methanogenesis marker 17 protein [Methanomicrobiales archaeon]|nr:methanogenesis marker 17 protein [Methanomicrobiales archaeon]